MISLLYQILTRIVELISANKMIAAEFKGMKATLASIEARLIEVQAQQKILSEGAIRIESQVDVLGDKIDHLTDLVNPPEAVKLTFICVLEGNTYVGDNMIVKAGQFYTATLKAVDKFGNAAVIDSENPPTWASSNPEVATVEPASDGLSAVVTSVGKVGTVQISVQADALLGPDVKLIVGTLDQEVLPGDAIMVTLEPGPVSDPVE